MGRTYNVAGYIHVIYWKEETVGLGNLYYRKANIGEPARWSYPALRITDDNARVSIWDPIYVDRAITTVRDTVPVVVWTDSRGADDDVYATTLGGKYTIDTSPSGLKVRVDNVDYWTPVSFYWAWGSSHSLYAPDQGIHTFVSWSDGGAQSHRIRARSYGEELIIAYYTPTLTLSVSPTTVYRGSTVTISGKLTPDKATTIRLYYRKHGTPPWALATTMATNSTGHYSFTATVPTSLTPGDYDLVAFWFDEATMQYAISPIRTLKIR